MIADSEFTNLVISLRPFSLERVMSVHFKPVERITYKRKPVAPQISLDQPGRLRFANLMALLSISHQTLYGRIASGDVPPPDGYDGRRPYWFCSTIRPLLEKPAT